MGACVGPERLPKAKKEDERLGESSVLVWGEGQQGQLGIGQRAACLQPFSLPALAGVMITGISCGMEHVAFLSDAGGVYVTGSGDGFRLGTGSTDHCWTPTLLPFSEEKPVIQVACGDTFTLFLTRKVTPTPEGLISKGRVGRGTIHSCGTSKNGALGLREKTCTRTPERLGLMSITKVVCGSKHSAALTRTPLP